MTQRDGKGYAGGADDAGVAGSPDDGALSDEMLAGVVGGVRRIGQIIDVCMSPGIGSPSGLPYPGTTATGGSSSGGQGSGSGDEAGTWKSVSSSGPKGS